MRPFCVEDFFGHRIGLLYLFYIFPMKMYVQKFSMNVLVVEN